jgi:hypothetical protein
MSRRRLLFSAAYASWLTPAALLTQPPLPAPEYQVKAACLYNFAKFVEWPEQNRHSQTPLVFGVLGEDPFGEELDAVVKGRSIAGRTITVVRYRSLEKLGPCHILFVSESEDGRLPMIFEALAGRGTLTVGDTPRFAARGGVIGFTMERQRIRFEVNLDAAKRAGIRISSRLLRLARVVRDEPSGGGD